MKRPKQSAVNEEVPFDISEIFFSTTNSKGIITGCNDVFIRVSGYEPDELLGHPHNVIRHPSMPRCVFYLLWDFLLKGRSIGAYVKNMAKDGRYYWVFALASPFEGGFISVRIKPTSPIFSKVKDLYAELLTLENSFEADWRAGMDASIPELQKRLVGLGFDSYVEFMTTALRQEMISGKLLKELERRDSHKPLAGFAKETTDSIIQVFSQLDSLIELRKVLRSNEDFFLNFAHRITLAAINASVGAAKLGEAGAPLSVVSSEISNVSKEIEKESSDLAQCSAELAHALSEMSFFVSQAIIQLRCVDFFSGEQSTQDLSTDAQSRRFGANVGALTDALRATAVRGIEKIALQTEALKKLFTMLALVSTSLEKILLTIQFSYFTGKTLTAQIEGADDFSNLLAELLKLSEGARAELGLLSRVVKEASVNVRSWGSLRTAVPM